MTRRVRVKRIAFVAIALAGILFIGVELFLLSADVRVQCVSVLERTHSWDSLVGMLDDDSADVRSSASTALARHGEASVPALIRGFDRLPERNRGLLAHTLGEIGSDARTALPALKRVMLTDDSDSVRETAAHAVGRVGRTDPETVAELIGALESGDVPSRIAAARAVFYLEADDRRRAVPLLARGLKHADPFVRQESAEGLGNLALESRAAIPELLEALKDPVREVRAEAAEALGHITHAQGWDDAPLRAKVDAAISQGGSVP